MLVRSKRCNFTEQNKMNTGGSRVRIAADHQEDAFHAERHFRSSILDNNIVDEVLSSNFVESFDSLSCRNVNAQPRSGDDDDDDDYFLLIIFDGTAVVIDVVVVVFEVARKSSDAIPHLPATTPTQTRQKHPHVNFNVNHPSCDHASKQVRPSALMTFHGCSQNIAIDSGSRRRNYTTPQLAHCIYFEEVSSEVFVLRGPRFNDVCELLASVLICPHTTSQCIDDWGTSVVRLHYAFSCCCCCQFNTTTFAHSVMDRKQILED
ncbi:unnamed protein product [Mesocestoides corti]|uniref:Uncharacterized protein n=2 Tax=Mesocestoides corti TaxID=53468 RepID=A0A158QSF2_MESCO|nr:unnamed protein product [Mesocestoides corti]